LTQVFEEIFKGLPQQPPPPAPASTRRPDGTVDPMEDVLQMMARMQAAGVAGSPANADEGEEAGGASALLPLMSGLLKQVLSKDVLYPALKSMLDRFPQYMEESRGKLKPEDVKRWVY
jgi:peroxin-19